MQDHAYRDAADERWFSYDGTQRNCGRLRCVALVWICHLIYFIFAIQTIPAVEGEDR